MFLLNQLDLTRKKIKGQLANILTLINLGFGITAIMFIFQGSIWYGFLFIAIAALFDRFDGLVARKLRIETELGKQLDSLSDLVSFGVAPALLVQQASLMPLTIIGGTAVVLFILCGALRLARFNITDSPNEFIGLPITAAGCILAFLTLFNDTLSPVVYIAIMISLSGLMISNIRVKKG
ncbi:CDP-diacylglycerol--serine O-phosphatidyltransferase [Alkalihalobacillus xiaoxiensis]|uniref:CDP-diacylglycerol--serine O-phosphatidyltransferase n=1 Tax=Shouchella xiaoxiensis TaxID=766895 RepID=A0ABS2SRD1_9BACI|nr:CDP-diacylglycerol--serine O-phosphatidyltransferase [Shouchella xiaoxiensis]